jgi:hypothetical protein
MPGRLLKLCALFCGIAHVLHHKHMCKAHCPGLLTSSLERIIVQEHLNLTGQKSEGPSNNVTYFYPDGFVWHMVDTRANCLNTTEAMHKLRHLPTYASSPPHAKMTKMTKAQVAATAAGAVNTQLLHGTSRV